MLYAHCFDLSEMVRAQILEQTAHISGVVERRVRDRRVRSCPAQKYLRHLVLTLMHIRQAQMCLSVDCYMYQLVEHI